MTPKAVPTLLLLAFLSASRGLADAALKPSFAEELAKQRQEIRIGAQGISGPGAELLLREAARARYVLIGEVHGLAEVSQLTRALYQVASPGYGIYAVEIGAVAAERLDSLADDPRGIAAIDEFQRQFPFAVPFAVFEDDAELMAAAARGGRLVGLDQEFLLASVWLLGEVEAALGAASPEASAELGRVLAAEEAAYQRMIETSDPEAAELFVNRPLPEQWPRWKELLAARPAAARGFRAMVALEETQHIYGLYHQQRYHDNNDQRAKVMKAHWRAATGTPGGPCQSGERALVRLGANHVMRGMSSLGISDFGNFIAETAAAQDAQSLHVLVLPTGGAVNAWLPFLPAAATSVEIDASGDSYAFYHDLLAAIPDDGGRAVYDLRPLRARHRRLTLGLPKLEKILLAYDLVVVVGKASPAPLLPSLAALAAGPAPAP